MGEGATGYFFAAIEGLKLSRGWFPPAPTDRGGITASTFAPFSYNPQGVRRGHGDWAGQGGTPALHQSVMV